MATAESQDKKTKKSVMTGSQIRDIPLQTPGMCRGPFSGPCPNLATAVVLRENNAPICYPLLTMGTPLSQLRDVPL